MPCVYLCNCREIKDIWISNKHIDVDTGLQIDNGYFTKIDERKSKDVGKDRFICLICGTVSYKSKESKAKYEGTEEDCLLEVSDEDQKIIDDIQSITRAKSI